MNKKRIAKFWKIFLGGILFVVFIQYGLTDLRIVRDSRPLYIVKNINLGYDAKMEMKIGKVAYDYIKFVRDNTPQDAKILIPPQAFPWDKTGNIAYLRYFIFPRDMVNGNEKDPRVDLNSVDYVLIDYGESTISQYGFTNVWPKFDVNAEYVIYWNPQDGTTRRINDGKYIYKANGLEEWGIIKVRK